MDTDAINDAGSTGANAGGKPARKVRDFLKAQAFYVAVVLLVAVMGSMKTWQEFRAQEAERRTGQPRENAGPYPLLQKDFEAQAQVFLNMARARPEDRFRRAVAFVETVESLNKYLLWGGAALALALGFSWALRGRSLAQPALPDPPWGLWDVAKVSALWAAGAELLDTRLFFPLNPARPFAVPGDWIAEIFIALLLAGATIHIVVAERGGHLRDLGIRGKFFGSVGLGLIAFMVVQPFLQLIVLLEERAARSGRVPEIPVQQIIQVIRENAVRIGAGARGGRRGRGGADLGRVALPRLPSTGARALDRARVGHRPQRGLFRRGAHGPLRHALAPGAGHRAGLRL